MRVLTGPVFVDTNVLVYARDSSVATKQLAAQRWLELLWLEAAGRTSVQVLAEYFSVVTRKRPFSLTPAEAWDDVRLLLAWSPRPVDADVLVLARRIQSRYGLNWWDCQIVAAAELQSCEVLLTEDLQDGARYGRVVVRSPSHCVLRRELYPIPIGAGSLFRVAG